MASTRLNILTDSATLLVQAFHSSLQSGVIEQYCEVTKPLLPTYMNNNEYVTGLPLPRRDQRSTTSKVLLLRF